MANKKVTYNPKTRKDLSNPYNGFTHSELLKMANIKSFNSNFVVEHQKHGRIIVKIGPETK